MPEDEHGGVLHVAASGGESLTHGHRTTYQDGCRCVPCKAANAQYQRALYALRQQGKAPMGSFVDAGTVRKLVKGMLIEGFTFAEIARRLGVKCERFRVCTDKVTVRKFLQVRRLYRAISLEGPES